MPADKVRIGFVGVGQMGQMAHLRNYCLLGDCEVVALAEPRAETARLVADRYGIAKVYGDHREMLATERLDGIVASQPFACHAALVPQLHRAAMHLFTEKPLAVMPEAGAVLAASAAETGCVHMVGYNKRSDPAVDAAKRIIDGWKSSGQAGPMRYVRLTMPPGDWIAGGFDGLLDAGDPRPEPLSQEPRPTGMDEGLYGEYVAFVNYYIHQVNLMRHLLGEPYRVTFADGARRVFVGESDSGVTTTLEMAPFQTATAWEESALVGFEHGYVRLDLPAPLARHRSGLVETCLDRPDAEAVRTRPVLPWEDSMRRQAANFVRVCRDEIAPPCDAAEAVEDLRVAYDYIQLAAGR